ncbi:hypothetical protein [Streptomyces boluensis]|uniref:Uncharacterized protein n=1 Tax=Streptomyces boluensis TaxID=1775135 RepID=A0A964USX2_9ACTN|nr:hypothetical protein [Streptomyces boluensis]NBE54843.1 hypothetical protein [Streptomyces boluensis]
MPALNVEFSHQELDELRTLAQERCLTMKAVVREATADKFTRHRALHEGAEMFRSTFRDPAPRSRRAPPLHSCRAKPRSRVASRDGPEPFEEFADACCSRVRRQLWLEVADHRHASGCVDPAGQIQGASGDLGGELRFADAEVVLSLVGQEHGPRLGTRFGQQGNAFVHELAGSASLTEAGEAPAAVGGEVGM